MNQKTKNFIAKRASLFRALSTFRDILPGSFSIRKIPCGKPNCVCKREGKLHDAFQLSYKLGDTALTKMIPRLFADQVQKQVAANKKLKSIIKQIQEINLQILFDQIENAKKK